MTNHPRYSPPPPPGHRPGVPEHAAPGYPGAQRPDPYQQQPYDWRYQTQQQQQTSVPLVRPMTRIAVPPHTARFPQAPMPRAASEAFSRRCFDSRCARGGHRVRRYRWGSRAACAAGPARSHVERQRRRPRHACREPACRLGRTGRGEGRSQRRQARGGPRQAIRGGLRDHPVLGRPHLDEQSRRHGGSGRARPGRVVRLRRVVRAPHRPK